MLVHLVYLVYLVCLVDQTGNSSRRTKQTRKTSQPDRRARARCASTEDHQAPSPPLSHKRQRRDVGFPRLAVSALNASPQADAVALCMDRERERRLVRRLIGQIDRAACLCRNRGRLIRLAPLSRPFAWPSILQHIPEVLQELREIVIELSRFDLCILNRIQHLLNDG